MRGEGAGIVVLKRLADALRDGDTIHAVIRGSAVNQDGRSNGLTAPNGPAQQAVLRAALADAGVAPGDIGCVEAHGTGTPLGDPIEMNALMAVLGEGRDRAARCAVGSVKTNIGHLESAAGIAGLVKTVLMLEHGMIAPHLHVSTLNPHIAMDGTPFVVPAGPIAWPAGAVPRRAGVSSFGFGGTNAHVILEEAPSMSAAPRAPQPLPVFNRQRFWIDESVAADAAGDTHPLLGRKLPALAHAPDTHVWETSIDLARTPYLAGHGVSGTAVLPYAAVVEMALAAGRALGLNATRIANLRLHHPIVLAAGTATRLQIVLDPSGEAWRVRVYNLASSPRPLSASATLINTQPSHALRPDVLCRQ